jgi:transposase
VIVVVDEAGTIINRARLKNCLAVIAAWLTPFRGSLVGIAVESTYNWYWLVDGLGEQGFVMHLANTVAIQQYAGMKHRDDASDAQWLADLLRLGLLPEGYIYPRKERAIRDLLRKRTQLVRQCTSQLLSIQNQFSRTTGANIRANDVKQLESERVDEVFDDPNVALAVKSNLSVMNCLQEQISIIEQTVHGQVRLRPAFLRLTSVPGIGKILALTIMLETGDIHRFEHVGHYVSYGRLVGSSYLSNGKRKGAGNTKNGNAFMCWAYIEAANFAIRFNASIRRYYDRKKARTKRIVALKTVAHKLARACYHMLKNDTAFDVQRAFV